MDMTTVFAPIMKTAPQPDGSILVYGKATGSDLDLDQQRCSPSWLARAVPEWFKIGNIREQHDPHRAVGKATEHDVREDGHYITAKIVDPVAKAKVEAGVFTGFSIGVKNFRLAKSADAPNGVIEDGRIVEVSIVDAPCLPTATLTVCKSATPGMEINAADFDEERGLVRCEELDENPSQPLVVKSASDIAAKENDVPTLADTLAPEALEKLAAAVEPADLPDAPAEPVETTAADKAADAEEVAADGALTLNEARAAVGLPPTVLAPAFDVNAAKALVDKVLAKADGDEFDTEDLAPMAAPSDETVASVAISLIAGLIQSEAQGMVDNPGEDCDIKCLLNAVAALRWFIRRERQETGAGGQGDASPYAYMAAEADEKPVTEPVVEKAAEPQPEFRNEGGDILDPDRRLPTKMASDTTKTTDPDAVKAAVVEDENPAAAIVKALSAALEKADSPLRASFEAIVKASTDAIQESTETTAEAVSDLAARLVKVENMAVPGGPALRRTDQERTSARKSDLAGQAAHYRALEAATHDQTLRKGYAATAVQIETELKALSA